MTKEKRNFSSLRQLFERTQLIIYDILYDDEIIEI